MNQLTVIDLFCGAGGFSEGFRQQGFKIKLGIDKWESAIRTFNHNFNLNCTVKNILDFQFSVAEIEALPDSDIIIGSPPCVTFSSSNISGKADKSSGITLTQLFLKVVAVKKWKQNSTLKAWFMENVPSSIKHLGNEYTFEELGLGDWATMNKIGRSKVAIKLQGNQQVINSADYGSAQCRERVIAGEIISRKRLIIPKPTHANLEKKESVLKPWRALKDIKKGLPSPFSSSGFKKITDPNYPEIQLLQTNLSDHFYDTGLFECEWKQSMFLKVNHPYMGKMSFPENEEKPSRTITATKIGTSREAIIYKSENDRKRNGEFRTPTVREAACIMGFPITYQFLGGETTKWRLVGNAVCPSVASAFAKQVRIELGLGAIQKPALQLVPCLENINNLNSYSTKVFQTPPKRNKGSRFRRHAFKDGNITVTLSNYDIDKNGKDTSKWRTSIQYGNGEGFPTFNLGDGHYRKIESIIKEVKQGPRFLDIINNGFSEKIAKGDLLQEMYEVQKSTKPYLEPTMLVEKVAEIINSFNIEDENFNQNQRSIFKNKEVVPLKQLFALYAINKIATIANDKQ
ncbi:MAG: DNA cytosine methyltransferase [Flavobacterium sp.]|nr:MAG: DNA cytosine methyltransferase [Flavobacterium sp.]